MTAKTQTMPKVQSIHSSVRKRKAINAGLIVLACLIGFLVAFPLYWLVRSALLTKSQLFARPPVFFPTDFQWVNFSLGAKRIDFFRQLYNSVSIAVPYVLGTVVTCSFAGYAFSRLRFPLRDMWFWLIVSSMMLPNVVTLLPQVQLYSALNIANKWALIVPAFFCAGGNAYFVFLLRQFFSTIPKELDEAARIDGAGFFRIYASIMLPLIRPALIVVALFSFINSWNEIFYTMIYLQSEDQYTLPLGLLIVEGIKTPHYEQVMALTLIVSIPCLVFFFIGNRYFVEGISAGAVKE